MIKKVKLMRAALVKYFYISANALIFYLFMSVMLLIGFWTNIDTWYRCCSLIAICLLQLIFFLRKIYLHLEELDNQVSTRCFESEDMINRESQKVTER